MAEMILPGIYIEVRDEGLISAGRISTGNIGIVGTAPEGPGNEPCLISSVSEAQEKFGRSGGDYTLVRSLELIYQNGGRTVYAVRVNTTASQFEFKKTRNGADVSALTLQSKRVGALGNAITVSVATVNASTKKVTLQAEAIAEEYTIENFAALHQAIAAKSQLAKVTRVDDSLSDQLPNNTTGGSETFVGGSDGDYGEALKTLENKIVNLVVLAGQDTGKAGMLPALTGHLKATSGIQRERIGVMGLGFDDKGQDIVPEDVPANDRLILVSPGILLTQNKVTQRLSAGYLAAAIAGVISALPVHTSPTNKSVVIEGLTTEFNNASLQQLVQKRVLAVEQRNGFRIVKGITTHDGAWQQITTRRIVDYAIYGVRSGCDPYIGKLNNARVRGAMKATLDGFLTRMVDNEALVSYQLEVSATRAQEIAGEAIVTMTLAPTFSIDFVKVTMYLS